MMINLPAQVRRIIRVLEENGYEAFAVGGCVRDTILGRTPNDWDITTSALPEETKALFKKTVDTGIQHGTVTVLLDGIGFEVTTYRIDGEYEDSRHPKEVSFTKNLQEDLQRRDFTINAMAYNDRLGIVDIFGGMDDLRNGVIRCVGEARERFSEDALRILRAVRFSAQLGFPIEEKTREAAMELAPTLSRISEERIQTELVKLLVSAHPDYLRTAWELGITAVVLPEFDGMMERREQTEDGSERTGERILRAVKIVRADKVLRLAVLLSEIGPEEAAFVLKRLKFDNDTLGKVKKLVGRHDWRPVLTESAVRRMASEMGEELFALLFEAVQAELLAENDDVSREQLKELEAARSIYQGILDRGECLSLKQLKINGKDLIADGMKPGRQIGELLELLLSDVLETPAHNTRDYLLEYSRKVRGEGKFGAK